ncbi:hypothetical protein LINPERHAP1_LOCUS6491 [Linum perenne]
MQIIQFADQKETLFEVKQLNNQIRKSLPRCILGVCSPPELKVVPVGLETPLIELKGKLLGDELPLVLFCTLYMGKNHSRYSYLSGSRS